MKSARIDQMEQYILENNSVSIDSLCEIFNISKSTAHRDIDELIRRGKTQKVYGGIRALQGSSPSTLQKMSLTSFEERNVVNDTEKHYICQKAAALVQPYDIIFIDSGTTCIHMIQYLKETPCTIVTNSLQVSMAAFPYEHLTLITSPGILHRKTWSYSEPNVDQFFNSINIEKAFMACTGYSIKCGLTNAFEGEYTVKRSVCQNSREIYLMADHDKYNRMALHTYCDLKDINGLITDRIPDEELTTYCFENKIQLIY